MKSIFVAALFAAAAAAQGVVISSPAPNTTLSPGQQFTVEVDRPDTLTNSREVSVAIGLITCAGRAPAGTCDGVDPSEGIGSVLFAGPYNPQLTNGSAALKQNFTVTVPGGFQSGAAALSVSHFSLIGALFFPNLQVVNETVIVQ